MTERWRSKADDYPEENCSVHPNRMWEWDGYGWICVSCIVQGPRYEFDDLPGLEVKRYKGELY